MRTIASHLVLLAVLAAIQPWRFLFRRDRKDEQRRYEALDEIFAVLRAVYSTTATLKDEWQAQWQRRDQVELPPKYHPDRYLYEGAVDAAVDAKFVRALLYQNRWRSRKDPLFEDYDPNTWSQVRAMIERSGYTLLAAREEYRDYLRLDEASWIDRAVEGLDQARYTLRSAERGELPVHEVIATATFQSLYSMLMLSEVLLDSLRREAEEQ